MGLGKRWLEVVSVGLLVMGSACSAPAPASPTTAAPKPPPAASAAPAVPPAAASPAASSAASPAPQPASSPAAAAPAANPAASADASLAPVWEGKTLTVIVSQPPGGGTDSTARVVARHIGRFLPGNPNVIVQNIPGGGDRIAANFIYAAKPDGLTIGLFDNGVMTFQLRGEGPEQGVRYDAEQFGWLGSPTVLGDSLLVHRRTGITPANIKQLESKTLTNAQVTPGSSLAHQPDPAQCWARVADQGRLWIRGYSRQAARYRARRGGLHRQQLGRPTPRGAGEHPERHAGARPGHW